MQSSQMIGGPASIAASCPLLAGQDMLAANTGQAWCLQNYKMLSHGKGCACLSCNSCSAAKAKQPHLDFAPIQLEMAFPAAQTMLTQQHRLCGPSWGRAQTQLP